MLKGYNFVSTTEQGQVRGQRHRLPKAEWTEKKQPEKPENLLTANHEKRQPDSG